ncbi:hypothetical protein M436DRAFT_40170 [Aureobasidium namibiae CBS 147.97]|uniref:C2H2-type domain-containing protein n=1 Tax=Aureobasidium namibiae CBS 147.97 TaxID=1043004 RepID=A0A074XNC1_9PEZI|nr:uncharacterized protein M436DRAFT_40170 [Aureobasidium namibiae CBS 147.97]KEQ76066.1 hypothetical protein M436DRAFT_40170 [Aureobasidium namibiae CBS 147.97]
MDKSPDTISPTSADPAVAGNAPSNQPPKAQAKFPPPKTDKPRPHVCGTCGRSFARLEHLKRHERSHTKEKPFECQECKRCFARRDLLLRHQQKLHFTNNPSNRPKNNRRESTSGPVNGGRVRKGSIANAGITTGTAGGRPRANTLGHLDLGSLGLMGVVSPVDAQRPTHASMAHHRMSMSNAQQRPSNLDLNGINGMTHHGMGQQDGFDLSRVDTHTSHIDFGEPLTHIHTAPAYTGMQVPDLEQLFTPGGNTVNPAQLHFAASAPQPINLQNFHMNQFDLFGQGDDFAWMRDWDSQLQSHTNNDAIDQSSPSQFSTASQSGYSETLADGPFHINVSQAGWNPNDMQALMTPGALNLDILGTGLPSIDPPMNTISPQNLLDPSTTDSKLDTLMMHSGVPDSLSGMHFNQFQQSSLSNFDSDSPSISSSSVPDSARQSSVTSISTDSITDATRQALLLSLSQQSAFSHRKFSQPSISSPLSPRPQGPSLPSTADLQRYINAYIQYFHSHLPFLHVPTLSFDSPEYMTNLRSAGSQASANHSGVVGGGGCLILAMAAIGALYEYDHQASKELFDSAKKMIQLYLEERRKADMSAAVNGGQYFSPESSSHNTPLWLVQAMLLNVIYGHYCGDKTAADIASNHCAALVSLARAAELAHPATNQDGSSEVKEERPDIHMDDGSSPFHGHTNVHMQWLKWKEAEERKRTLFAIFILSSLLVIAYNQTPAITNSEILLALPCDEELWTADSAREWAARGGAQAAEANATSFSAALSDLLTANQRQQNVFGYSRYSPNGDSHGLSTQLRPSTFGCLVLINALHNYIWETRSRHIGRQWTAQETDSMVAHIEPALNAWQAAWKANDRHKLQRPNPFGLGPLAADSIPLLDLAFVRLFVNLGRSKEAFWQRDFEAMSEELASGIDIAQTGSPDNSSNGSSGSSPDFPQAAYNHGQMQISGHSSKRERHLRKAAFYAADSLVISSKCNLTFADSSAHELPIQSAICFLDCAQVLAEWETTVQERIGRYVGVLGQIDVDYSQVPAVMLLDTEDVELLKKMESICNVMEEKMALQAKMLAHEMDSLDPNGTMGIPSSLARLNGLSKCGLGSRILRMTAQMLEKAAVWPVTHVMASALETQANHADHRADSSITA